MSSYYGSLLGVRQRSSRKLHFISFSSLLLDSQASPLSRNTQIVQSTMITLIISIYRLAGNWWKGGLISLQNLFTILLSSEVMPSVRCRFFNDLTSKERRCDGALGWADCVAVASTTPEGSKRGPAASRAGEQPLVTPPAQNPNCRDGYLTLPKREQYLTTQIPLVEVGS